MGQGVWTIAEQREGEIRKITYELVSEGRRLADALGQELTVLLLGANVKDKAAELGQYGADKVMVADDARLEPYTTDAYVSVISQLVKEGGPAVLLLGASVQPLEGEVVFDISHAASVYGLRSNSSTWATNASASRWHVPALSLVASQ